MTSFLAKGIASALLAGEWSEGKMSSRLASALAETRAPWMGKLVRFARKEFPNPPRDARDALAAALLRSKAWPDVLAARVHVRRTILDVPEMRPTVFRVPPIATPGDLAAFLQLDVRKLDAYADRRNLARFAEHHERMRHYRYRSIAKPDGGVRILEIPKPRLRAVQREILDRILALIPPHESAHGFRVGQSVIDYVRPHVGRHVVIRVDLRSFFQSIRAGRVNAVWRAVGYPEEVSRVLTALTTHAAPSDALATLDAGQRQRLRTPHLPQGAPTSPALANLIAFGLDVRLSALAKKLDATYGRYADDLALSGDATLARAADDVVVTMMRIAIDEGSTSPEEDARSTSGISATVRGLGRQCAPCVAATGARALRGHADELRPFWTGKPKPRKRLRLPRSPRWPSRVARASRPAHRWKDAPAVRCDHVVTEEARTPSRLWR